MNAVVAVNFASFLHDFWVSCINLHKYHHGSATNNFQIFIN